MVQFLTKEQINKAELLRLLQDVRVGGVAKKTGDVIELGGMGKIDLIHAGLAEVVSKEDAAKLTKSAEKKGEK